MSWHEGVLAPFDLETTSANPEVARIVTGCAAKVGRGHDSTVTTWLADPGVDIPEEATKIHGVTTEMARTGGQAAALVLGEIVDWLGHVLELGIPVVGHNLPYDFTVVDRECRRRSGEGLEEILGQPLAPVIDTYVLSKHVDRRRRRVSPTQGAHALKTCAQVYGVPWSDEAAHEASYDALTSARVAWKIAVKHPAVGALSLSELHEMQVTAKAEQDRSLAEYFRGLARKAKTADEQTDLWARAESCTGAWPLVPMPVQAVTR